jgi:hypothetical protein
MFRPLSKSHRRPPRRGTSFILIVVVMLALFSAVGTAYALFAMREARLALQRKTSEGGGIAPPMRAPDPTDTINRFFGTFIYDTDDNDIFNAMRGYGGGRSIYGRDVLALNTGLPLTNAYGGVGIFHEANPCGDRATQPNHTFMLVNGAPFLLDPEYMGVRPLDASGNPLPFDPTTRTYVGKNAGYSYADLKDFFLAAYDPATGEVLAPSFHRPWLFGSLDPTNPNWLSPTGQLMILRPRPAEHPNFPRVPPDPDGVYRGDVQNMPGGVGPQKNDSIWMDIGLPPITMPGGKKVKPMVAPLIVPLNGLLNASAHGNTYYGGGHSSYYGLGPWEVNLSYLLGPDAPSVVNGRGPLQQRAALTAAPYGTMRSYAPYLSATTSFSLDGAVAWNNTLIGMPPVYPQGNSIAGVPAFVTSGLQTSNAAVSHPALFNPVEWLDRGGLFASGNRVYQLSDAKRFNFRYADVPDWYAQSDLARQAPNTLFPQIPVIIQTRQNTPNNYRLDPSHGNRGIVTTFGFDLDRPKVTPVFPARTAANSLMFPAPPPYTNPFGLKPTLPPVTSYPSPVTTPVGPATDFAAQNRWTNAFAALSAVNLNRQLADYRTPAAVTGNLPIAGNLAGQVQLPDGTTGLQADWDRQQLARDIFARLIVATGAAGYVDTVPATGVLRITLPDPVSLTFTVPSGASAGTPAGPFTQAQYDALRYLAQLAANIVDYIDNDDVSTTFAWNPNPGNGSADFTNPTDVGYRVVFGVERPRLVINEAYSEITNDPTEVLNSVANPAGKPAQVRFWVELLNPTAQPPAGSPLGTGAVPLSAYRIEVRRAYRQTVAGGTAADANGTVQNNYLFLNPANTTGGFDTSAAAPDAVFTFPQNNATVAPNSGTYTPAANNTLTPGMVLVGPPVAQQQNFDEFAPNTAAGVWQGMVQSPALGQAANSQGMGYTIPLPQNAPNAASTEFRRHIVLLRRLANPYMPPGPTNQYVTVDMMDYVQSFDAIMELSTQIVARTPGNPANATTYDSTANRSSAGKVQPYAGHAAATTQANAANTYAFPLSMVVNQTFTDKNTTNVNGNTILDTFGVHNGSAGTQPAGQTYNPASPPTLTDPTLMTPFDWLPHMDRTLVNQLELLQVRDTAPHRLTDTFLLGTPLLTTPATGITYDTGYAQWFNNGLSRALEYLTVKPYTMGVASGGRVPGRINVNAVPEQRVLTGLMDPQPGNVFDQSFVTNTAWSQWMQSRTATLQNVALANGTSLISRTGPPTQTFAEANSFGPGIDRPFLPFGAPAVIPGSPFAYGAGGSIDNSGNNLDLTMLRRSAAGNPPLLFANLTSKAQPPTYPTSQPNGPSYFQAEPARKVLNNVTTVNQQYAVFLTIGYFELDAQNPPLVIGGTSVPRLGAEAYINVPGDMRQKVVAVVDLSNMALDPLANTVARRPAGYPGNLAWRPFFTSLQANAYGNGSPSPSGALNIAYSRYDGTNLYVAADGQEVAITVGSTLVLGYGTDQQIVTVTAVGQGQVTVAANNGLFRTAWAGTCVSNVRPGYPGDVNRLSQPFDCNAETYKALVPYFERLK